MSEYMVKVEMSAAGTRAVGIKGRVMAVYSSAPISLSWDYNGEVGVITPAAVTEWEPHNGFAPMPTSKLLITSTGPVVVTIRME